MILFFQSPTKTVLAVETKHAFSAEDTQKLVWLFSEAKPVESETLNGWFVGIHAVKWSLHGVQMLLKSPKIWAWMASSESKNISRLHLEKLSMTQCFNVSTMD